MAVDIAFLIDIAQTILVALQTVLLVAGHVEKVRTVTTGEPKTKAPEEL